MKTTHLAQAMDLMRVIREADDRHKASNYREPGLSWQERERITREAQTYALIAIAERLGA